MSEQRIFENKNFNFYSDIKNENKEYYLDIIIDDKLLNTINIKPHLANDILGLISHDTHPNNPYQQMKETLDERTYVKTLIFEHLDSKDIISYFL